MQPPHSAVLRELPELDGIQVHQPQREPPVARTDGELRVFNLGLVDACAHDNIALVHILGNRLLLDGCTCEQRLAAEASHSAEAVAVSAVHPTRERVIWDGDLESFPILLINRDGEPFAVHQTWAATAIRVHRLTRSPTHLQGGVSVEDGLWRGGSVWALGLRRRRVFRSPHGLLARLF